MARSNAAAVLLLLLLLAIACQDEPDHAPAADFEAPIRARAAVSLEPPSLEIGEVASIEVLVVAPAGHRVSAVSPSEIEGISLLGTRTLPHEESARGWTHRTRFRIRAESVGVFEWPGHEIGIEGNDGETYTLVLPAKAFEVTSVTTRFPQRDQPFGLEELESEAPPGHSAGFWFGLGLGALLSVATALGVATVRRHVQPHAEAVPSTQSAVAPDLFAWTENELAEALTILDADPRRAASVGAHLMRIYMARRFGSQTEAATTQELERRAPALAEHSCWPDFVRILHQFDDARFQRSSDDAATGARVRAALEASRRLIESSNP